MNGTLKKWLSAVVLFLLSVALMSSCGTQPEPVPSPKPDPDPATDPEPVADDTFLIPFPLSYSCKNDKKSFDSPWYTLYGYVDPQGNWVLDPKYNYVSPFTANGTAVVGVFDPSVPENKDAYRYNDVFLYGIIDRQGNYLLEPQRYVVFWQSENGLITYQRGFDELMGVFDASGNTILEPTYPDIRAYENGYAVVYTEGWRCGIIDEQGNLMFEPVDHTIVRVTDADILITADGDFYALMDMNGNPVPSPTIGIIGFMPGDPVFYVIDAARAKWGLLDHKGLWVAQPVYESLSRGTGTPLRYSAYRDGKYGYLDETGAEVIPVKYAYVNDFYNGVASVCMDGIHWGLIDASGNTVLKPDYLSVDAAHCNGLVSVLTMDMETKWFRKDGTPVDLPGNYHYWIDSVDLNNENGYFTPSSEVMVYMTDEGLRLADAHGKQLLAGPIEVMEESGSIGAVVRKYEECRRWTVITNDGRTLLMDYDGFVIMK